jgi:hypothetical protein
MALGDLEVKGKLKVVGTTEMAGFAKDATLITNLNADKVDSADLDTDGALSGNSDSSIPTEKAVKTYVDTADALKANDNAVVKLTGNQTVAGVKTFSSDPVATVPSVRDQGSGGGALKCAILPIGDWNLETTASFDLEAVLTAASIVRSKVRSLSLILRNDADSLFVPIPQGTSGANYSILYLNGGNWIGCYYFASYNTLIAYRVFASSPSYADWNATSYNRGWITIWYVA